jgi:hypothetical protein
VRRLADHFKVSIGWLVGETASEGQEQERNAALIRAVNDLNPPNRELLDTIIDGMRRNQNG